MAGTERRIFRSTAPTNRRMKSFYIIQSTRVTLHQKYFYINTLRITMPMLTDLDIILLVFCFLNDRLDIFLKQWRVVLDESQDVRKIPLWLKFQQKSMRLVW